MCDIKCEKTSLMHDLYNCNVTVIKLWDFYSKVIKLQNIEDIKCR